MSANIVARSREEAVKLGLTTWLVPKPPKRRTLSLIDEELASARQEQRERKSRVDAIRNGYAPPRTGEMGLVNPACERQCPECWMACAMFMDMAKFFDREVEKLEAERAKLTKRSRRPLNVIDLAEEIARRSKEEA